MRYKVLIVEDEEQVGLLVEHLLAEFDNFHVDHSASAAQSIDRINAARQEPYDLILCDYHLGENTNGQQLLEFLRFERRIPRRTGFIMLTGDASYPAVASAVELVPDSYLLKPFTRDALHSRVTLAVGKRQALKSVYEALDQPQPDWKTAVGACTAAIVEAGRFTLEALRIKAECHLKLGNWGEAASVYDKIVAWRPTAWAEVGRARALRNMGHPELALEKLKAALELFPQYVAAYDELAALALEDGQGAMAQEILERAHAIVPSNRRSRQLGLLALDNGDLETASRFLQVVVDRDRYGLMRSTEDFFGLASALRQLGRYDEAFTVLDSLKDHFPETRPLTVRKMAAEAMVKSACERHGDARQTVREALEIRDDRMEPRTQMELAEACHHCGEEEAGRRIFVHVAENWQEDPGIVAQVKTVMARVMEPEQSARMIDYTLQELVAANNEAAALMKAGKVDEVIGKMEVIAKRLPNHATVQANFIQALLVWLEQHAPPNLMELPYQSRPRLYLAAAREHLRRLAVINPAFPRLAPLQRGFAKLTGEVDVAAAAMRAQTPEEAAEMVVGE
ncbi:MAG TPA: response regulator [Rhodocyclaceae bacterium]|nr:response regulator [Rhodocyclaceae bacterium]